MSSVPAQIRRRSVLGARLCDDRRMLAIFRRCLPELARTPLRVTACRLRGTPRRLGGRLRVAWQVRVEVQGGAARDVTLVGTAPVGPDFLSPELMRLCRTAGTDPTLSMFDSLATHLEGLDLALVMFPVDPVLHGLVDVTGADGPDLLARHLDDCRRGARVGGLRWELTRYEPCRTCELTVTAALSRSEGGTVQRLRVKAFADDRGRGEHESLHAVWVASHQARHLRVPRPYGYDDDRRLLFAADVPAGAGLAEWTRRLELDQPLPEAVSTDDYLQTIDRVLAALRELHRMPVESPRERTFRHELAVLHRHASRLLPDPAGAIGGLLDRLGAARLDEDALVPAHGALRPTRTAGTGDRLVLTGWDQLCMSSPALDAATFIGRLRQAPIQHPGRACHLAELAEAVRCRACKTLQVASAELAVYEAIVLVRHALGILRRRPSGSIRARRLIDAAAERAMMAGV